jgi:CspA family cold shock protein
MIHGTVKFFNAAKGFGFISPDGGGKDVFVPANSLSAAGVAALKAGQRVSFQTEPDSKGPKAVGLKLLAEPPRPAKEPAKAPAREAERLTLLRDPDDEDSDIVLEALRAAGHEPRLVDYIAAPPPRDDLKTLSLLLRGSDQSLVRKYDPLFRELSLDDRFISENEFWTAVFEHPSLINGPVIAGPHKARICRSEDDVMEFLGLQPVGRRAAAKPAIAPARIAALLQGASPPQTAAAVAAAEPVAPAKIVKPAAEKPAPAAAKPKAKVSAKPSADAKTKAPAKATAKASAKPPAKSKPAKKAPAKPAKKSRAKR